MPEQIAVVRGARYGRWNGQRAGLFFETWLPDGNATLHILRDAAARRLMAQAGVTSAESDALVAQIGEGGAAVKPLEGHECFVVVDGYTTQFLRLAAAH
ncbi:MAG TPA: hypothetical protein VFN74_21990 [Chloroflexota bacterium]|nr:hypothetical protein [Chloroflexota bacterium]